MSAEASAKTVPFPPPGPERFGLTDLGLVERFFDKHANMIRYCPPRRDWFVWRETHWSLDTASEVWQRAALTVRQLYGEAERTNDIRQRQDLAAFARQCEARRRIEAIVALAEHLALDGGIVVQPTDFDADPFILNTPTGIIDLKTGKVRPHKRAALCSKITAAPYIEGARSELWDSFLARVLPDPAVRSFVQRAAGAALVGRQLDERLYFVHGPQATGKSTFMRATQATLGSYATVANFETFLERNPQAGGAREDLARLAGARLVVSLEVDEGRRLAVGVLKALTGGDVVAVRFLYGRTFEFVPNFSLWLVANVRPRVPAEDGAVWRRVLEIPFMVEIPENERDPEVKRRLCDPGESGAAILAWLVEGCQAHQRVGLNVPEPVRMATAAYQDEVDTLGHFLAERTEAQPGFKAPAGELYQAYRHWSVAAGEMPVSGSRFRQRMQGRGFRHGKGKAGATYLGLALVHDEGEP